MYRHRYSSIFLSEWERLRTSHNSKALFSTDKEIFVPISFVPVYVEDRHTHTLPPSNLNFQKRKHPQTRHDTSHLDLLFQVDYLFIWQLNLLFKVDYPFIWQHFSAVGKVIKKIYSQISTRETYY